MLLHGLAGQSGEWDGLVHRLGTSRRIVAVDQRGHGLSERHPRDVSRAAYAADVIAVLDQLKLDRAVLVGQSLGGHTAMLAAAAHPDRVSGLVLVEAGPRGPQPDLPGTVGGWLASWPAPFPTRSAAVEFLGGGPVGEGWASGLEEHDDGLRPRFDQDVMVRSLHEMAARSFWSEWERVSCPTALVVGQSGVMPPEEIAEMVARRPDAVVAATVRDAGHDLHLEQPDALHRILTEFIDGLP
ncbi:2-(acetamidomethylene)succinate hydrolase [Actinosynnema sp. ALI-1.44]